MSERDSIPTPRILRVLYRTAQVLATCVMIGIAAIASMMIVPAVPYQVATWIFWFFVGCYIGTIIIEAMDKWRHGD